MYVLKLYIPGIDNSNMSCRHHKLTTIRAGKAGKEIGFARGQEYDDAAHKEAVKAGDRAREELIKAKREELEKLRPKLKG